MLIFYILQVRVQYFISLQCRNKFNYNVPKKDDRELKKEV